MGNTWDTRQEGSPQLWDGMGGDTNWEQVKVINEWVEQKTGLRWPQGDIKDETLRTKYRGEYIPGKTKNNTIKKNQNS